MANWRSSKIYTSTNVDIRKTGPQYMCSRREDPLDGRKGLTYPGLRIFKFSNARIEILKIIVMRDEHTNRGAVVSMLTFLQYYSLTHEEEVQQTQCLKRIKKHFTENLSNLKLGLGASIQSFLTFKPSCIQLVKGQAFFDGSIWPRGFAFIYNCLASCVPLHMLAA